ncbi:ABC transporter ATP-binding protein [Rhodoluna sp.]|jgi:putative ABC transport system ATP-binding protein|uniref:ABC transporter ATP-binding protein n=1 Tax=Rhodoluna sp. TaxID=1969481 RepID=UPI0025DEB8E1|nr:ABC transporter ATP-binding protein [Rhodoluna sp.]
MSEILINLSGIRKTYGSGDTAVEALKGVDLQVSEGELVAIMGASGSGKSTLLSIAGGLEKPTQGSAMVAGFELFASSPTVIARLRRQTLGYVFQDFNLIPALSVIENVALPLELDGEKRSKARTAALEALKTMGIEELAKRFPDEISGGQRQRVAIARSIVGPRKVILADEPTGALDSRTGEAVIRALRSRIDAGAGGILVTHDAKNAAWADRILIIRDGLIVDETKTQRDLNGLIENA